MLFCYNVCIYIRSMIVKKNSSVNEEVVFVVFCVWGFDIKDISIKCLLPQFDAVRLFTAAIVPLYSVNYICSVQHIKKHRHQ